jgi:hypothetical protein
VSPSLGQFFLGVYANKTLFQTVMSRQDHNVNMVNVNSALTRPIRVTWKPYLSLDTNNSK